MKRSQISLFFLGFVMLLLGACKSERSNAASTNEPGPPPEGGRLVVDARGGKTCELPISVYCKDRPCVPYPAAATAARALVSRTGIWGNVELGTCGPVRYVHRAAWYMSQIEYYDATDAMLGAEETVDNLNQYCDGKSGHATYGKIPTCVMVPKEIILDGGPIP